MSCIRQTTFTQSRTPRPISHIRTQYMGFVVISNVSLDLSGIYFIFFILVGVELPLCIVVIVVMLS